MAVALLALLLGCTQDEETTYTQYNGDDESVTIDVGSDTVYVLGDDGVTEIPEEVSVALESSTGAVEIGVATVSPSAGPIGTVHTVVVEFYDDYADAVDRVSVRTDSGDRGEDEYDLERDSAGEGYWKTEIESVGEEGETREDTLTFYVWQEDDAEE